MENIIEFPDQKVIEQEAIDWIIKLDGDEPLTKQEHSQFKAWLARSPAHIKELNNLNEFWQDNVLTELMVPLTCAAAHRKQSLFSSLKNWFGANARWQFAFSATAVVFTASLLLATLFSTNEQFASNGLYLTGIGKLNHTVLADGTVMHMNTDSQVEVAFNDNYRNIRIIRGEAHFEVAKNKDYPLRVYAGDGRVEAVGTAFSVYLADEAIDVLVTEGRVAVAALSKQETEMSTTNDSNKKQVDLYSGSSSLALGTLDAGQQVSLDISDGSLQQLENIKQITDSEIKRRLSWQKGLLTFNGESLEQVATEISRFTTVDIEIIDEKLKQLAIGGRFKVGEIEDFFLVLQTNFGISVERLSYNKVRLSPIKQSNN
ncbi:MAG: FecR domain-containing protein [Alteromonadaceae bacterium]|nr:FecR domain-containing protein [Alteromonadaceae bacterium]